MNPSFLPSPGGISKSLILPPPEKAKIWHALCCLDAGRDAVGESEEEKYVGKQKHP